jgi:hypothetical protein
MALIVAIEPDKRQAGQLLAVVRERLGAELVLADTAERALAQLGDRVPDLILTSALLSTKDEAAIADHLRALDSHAAHVQTLTIPVLASAKPRASSGRGMLSALLGDRTSDDDTAPDGCDPAVFADQCAAYLDRVAAERQAEHESADHEAVVEAAAPPAVVQPAVALVPVRQSSSFGRSAALAQFEMGAAATDSPIDFSSLLDDTVVEQLSAAIQSVETKAAVEAHQEFVPPPAPTPRTHQPTVQKPPLEFAQPADADLFDPGRCGFAELLAKLNEITLLAPALPSGDPLAGPPSVSR